MRQILIFTRRNPARLRTRTTETIAIPANMNTLTVHVGNAGELFSHHCATIDANDQATSTLYVERRMVELLEVHGGPLESRCRFSNGPVLRITYVGKGVCIDCKADPALRSGFAFISLESRDGSRQYASAEWQY